MTKVYKFLVLVLFFITVTSRFLILDKVPPSLSNDEISIAYDSYSILHTGRDEHNNFMPASFQSHNTYKAPFYIYAATITNYFLGNSEYSVRLPSAIFGSLTVFLLGYLVFFLSKSVNLSLITAYILALSPWHIYSSRMALESNAAIFLLLTALLFLFKVIKSKNNFYLFLSMGFFALSIWAYHTEWLLTPLLMLFLVIYYRKSYKVNSFFILAILFFGVLIFPIAKDAWVNRNTNARANTEIITKDRGLQNIIGNTNISLLMKTKVIGQSFFTNYSDYVRPSHLFFDGMPLLPKEDPYTVGLFLLPLLPFFYWGLFKIKKFFPVDFKFIYFWIFISPVIPSITIGGTNMVRNLASVLPYSIVIGCGFLDLLPYLKKTRIYVFSILIIVSLLYFGAIYYYHFPFQMGENFQYGYKQAAEYISENYNKYDQIIVDPRFGDVNIYVGVPHLYLAYFTKLDPNKMLSRKDTDNGLFFDKYRISSINWNQEIILPRSLYLVPFDNLPPVKIENLYTAKEIKLPNYKVEFKLLESTN